MSTNPKPPLSMRTVPARVVEVPAGHEGRRLDKFLRSQFKVPATSLFRLLRKGRVRVNDKRVEPGYRLKEGDLLQLPAMELPEEEAAAKLPESLVRQIAQGIVYEDAELVVLNKPADVAVHVGTGVAGGVIEALRQLRPGQRDLELVHRLDRETSGLLMVAKTSAMLRHLQRVLREDAGIERYYLALVYGAWPETDTEVRARLRRTDHGVIASRNGQSALTRFSVVRRFGKEATLVRAQLITGRKHQIRVHAQFSGHPIAGDQKYGKENFNRKTRGLGAAQMFLHAVELGIPLPDGEILRVSAPTPASWDRVMDQLGGRGTPPATGSSGKPQPRAGAHHPGSGNRSRRPRPRRR